jgi:hypothetical protein
VSNKKKSIFLIENQQEYNQFMEVTVISPSFDLKTKNVFLTHFYSKKYEIKLVSGE